MSWLLLTGCILTTTSAGAQQTTSEADFASAVSALAEGNFNAKRRAAEDLAQLHHPRVGIVLNALLNRDLFTRRADGLVVIAESTDDGYEIAAAATGEPQGVAGRRDVRRISTNNALRAHLRSLLATVALNSPSAAARRTALEDLLDNLDAAPVTLIAERMASESDSSVQALMQLIVDLDTLENDDIDAQRAALARLAGDMTPVVAQTLSRFTASTDDPSLREAADAALNRIEQKRSLYRGLENLFFGLSLGSVLVLAAIGLSITFGVMGVINMAHGELIMLGAYTTYVLQLLLPDALALALLLAIPLAFVVSGSVGILIERGVIRFLYGRPLETLLATFGVSLILQQAVRSIFSPLNRAVATPEFLSGSIEITQGLAITSNRLYILLFTLLVFGALLLLLNRTRLGLEVRAVAQNRQMARAMGVRSNRVDAFTFGLGSGVAGIAGVALSQLTNVGPNLGQAYIVDSFLVVVFGGVGNLWGTLVAGMSMGVLNKFLEPFTGAVLAKILVLIGIILFIQKKPKGLFPQLGRAVDG